MSELKGSEKIFNAIAARYEEELSEGLAVTGEDSAFYARGRISALYSTLNHESRKSVRKILDFGCGVGGSREYFYEFWPDAEYVGFDPSKASLKVAAKRHLQPKTAWSLSTAGLADFDLVFTNGVFHHILPKDRTSAFGAVRTAMRPTGLFTFFENNPWNPGTLYIMRRVRFDRDAVTISPCKAQHLLRKEGFSPIHFSSLFYFPSALACLRPLERWLRQIPFGGQYFYVCSLR